jgi:hypothetical protein
MYIALKSLTISGAAVQFATFISNKRKNRKETKSIIHNVVSFCRDLLPLFLNIDILAL